MLKHRVVYGTVMFAGLGVMLFLDHQLERLNGMGDGCWPPGLLMLIVFWVLIAFSACELRAIFCAKGIQVGPAVVMISSLVGCGAVYAIQVWAHPRIAVAAMASVMALVFLGALLEHSIWHRRMDGAVGAAAAALFAFVYLGLMPGFYVSMRLFHGVWIVAAIIAITKIGDCGAYFTGRLIGRRRLVPRLSPGKTWEGLAGAVVAAAVTSLMLGWVLNTTGQAGLGQHAAQADPRQWVVGTYPYWAAALAGVVLGLVGQMGDLLASLLKRDAGVKDSGDAIPGFGGLLDVFDSPIVVAPVAYWLLVLAEPID